MASSQGGVGAVTSLQSHHYSSGPPWTPGVSQYQQQQQQQQYHTARSLDRALEDAGCSGILNLSGRRLREYPGMSYDLTDTTQAGERDPTRLVNMDRNLFLNALTPIRVFWMQQRVPHCARISVRFSGRGGWGARERAGDNI